MFPLRLSRNGQVGIAFIDGGVTIGQCGWDRGHYTNTKVTHIEKNPRDFTADDWQSICGSNGVSGSDCVISLPMSMIHHQILRLPDMKYNELKEAASWEMSERFGIDRHLLQTDAIRVGTGGDVLALAIEKEALESLLNPIYASGMRPTSVEPQCISVARTFSMLHRRQSDQGTVRSVFNFCENDSSFLILDGDNLVFFKHFPYSGQSLLKSIESHTGVTNHQAALMLKNTKANLSDPSITQAVGDATRSIHEAIAKDAMKCTRHYGVTNRGPLSSCLYVTGSAGWNHHLGEVLSNACNQEVLPDIAAKHINQLDEKVCATAGWHVALGASLANIERSKSRRNSDQPTREAA